MDGKLDTNFVATIIWSGVYPMLGLREAWTGVHEDQLICLTIILNMHHALLLFSSCHIIIWGYLRISEDIWAYFFQISFILSIKKW